MTSPFDPSSQPGDPSGTPTQPVPPITQIPTFAPASPEPMPATAPVVGSGPSLVPAPSGAIKPAKKSGGSSMILNAALGVAVLVATAGVAFAVGRSTAPASTPTGVAANGGNGGRFFTGGNGPNGSFTPGQGNGAGNGGRGFGFGGGAAGALSVSGTVDSVTADSVTIKTSTGNTITVGLDPTTTYHQQAAGTSADVQSGKTVILQLSGGSLRPGGNGNAGNGAANASPGTGGGNTGTTGGLTLGTASDVTVVP